MRTVSLIILVVLSGIGFGMWRYYQGWGQYWIRYYVSGIVYVMIWSVGLFIIRPGRKNTWRIPIIAFILTCGLEFLQLYKPPILQFFRATLIGAALIGTDFVWLQFPFYMAGILCSYLLLRVLFSIQNPHYQYLKPYIYCRKFLALPITLQYSIAQVAVERGNNRNVGPVVSRHSRLKPPTGPNRLVLNGHRENR